MNNLEPMPRPTIIDALQGELQKMSIEELRVELARGLQLTAEHFMRLAMVIKELESRDEDLSKLRVGKLLHHLRRIACGQLLPEVLVRFAESRDLISRVSCLPLQDQKRLVSGEGVRLVVYTPSGEKTHRMANPSDMSHKQIQQAFDRDHVRNDAEQELWLDQRRTESQVLPDKIGDLRIDRVLGGAYLGRKFIPQADIVAAAKALQS